MTSPRDLEALKELAVQYLLGGLGRAETAAFERQLAEDPELAAEVSSLRKTLHLLSYATVTDPPPQLRWNVLRAARTVRQQSAVPFFSRLSWGSVFSAVAALLAIAFGWDSYRLRQELQMQKEVALLLQQPNVILSFSLKGAGTFSPAFGSVVLDLDAKKAAVAIRGLPSLPPKQVYRLWALVGEEAVPCGQFNANAQSIILSQFPIPVDAYTAPISQLILTQEATSASPRPVGPTVMVSS